MTYIYHKRKKKNWDFEKQDDNIQIYIKFPSIH